MLSLIAGFVFGYLLIAYTNIVFATILLAIGFVMFVVFSVV